MKFNRVFAIATAFIAILAFGGFGVLAANSLDNRYSSTYGSLANQAYPIINPSATATATLEPSGTPQGSKTPEPSKTPTMTKTPGVSKTPQVGKDVKITGKVISITGDVWMVGDFKVVTDARTQFDGMPKVGDMVKIEAIFQSDGSYLAREVEVMKPEASKTPGVTRTPEDQGEIEFSGKVVSITGNTWVIGTFTVVVDAHTEIDGHPVVGSMVSVEAVKQADGSLLAKEIDSENTGNGEKGGGDGGHKDDKGGSRSTPPGVGPTAMPTSTVFHRSKD